MAAVAEMGEVDEIHSNEESIKDGVSVNGDVCGDYKSDVDDEANEINENVTIVSEDAMDQDQSLTDDEKTDGDDPSVHLEDLGSAEENEMDDEDEIEKLDDDDEIEKLDDEEIMHNEDSNEQIHEIDNSDVEESEKEESENSKSKADLINGLGSPDEIIIENTSENVLVDHSDKVDENSIIINDSGEVDCEDVVVLDDKDPIENGSIDVSDVELSDGESNHKASDDGDIITLEDTPKKKKKSLDSGPPRRSSRNLNKEKKSYLEEEEFQVEEKERQKKLLLQQQQQQQDQQSQHSSDDESESDIEEVMPQDPLAVADPTPPPPQIEKAPIKKSRMSSSTIVVKDTKCLAEIASKSTANNHNKKEPTLVIIDTNSILSGRGPVPIAQKPAPPPAPISNTYSMLPMALPAQGVYPANMRATITPIPMTPPPPPPKPVPPPPPPPPVLPTLTDDMFVVEAPSFIVPYVYEKPPIKELRDFVRNLESEIAEQKKKDESADKAKEDKAKEDKAKEDKAKEEKAKEDKVKEEKEKQKNEEQKDEKEKVDKDSDKSEEGLDKKEEDEKMDVDKDEEKDAKSDSEKEKESALVASEKEKEDNKIEKEEKAMDTDLPSMPVPSPTTLAAELRKPPATYFDSPLGKFFMGIGYSLVQEHVQTDLLKQQKRKRDREGGQNPETLKTINSLLKNLEFTKENNEPYRMETKKCEFCSFKTESSLAMAFHLETPHMKNYVYRCNFCPYEVRSPHDILFHMEVQHGVRGRLERAPAFHQCPNCPFEDNQKGKLSRHLVACTRKFKPDRNLEPPSDYEPPAKIPRAPRMKQQGLGTAAAVYQAMARTSQYQMMSKMAGNLPALQRGRGRPTMGNPAAAKQSSPGIRSANMLYKSANMSGGSVLVPTNYQLSGNQLYQVVGGQEMGGRMGPGGATAFLPSLSAAPNSITIQQQQPSPLSKMKPVQQPSISITPLPRGTPAPGITITKPGDSNPKNSFVICEICDGYIKDLEQLRNHMQWIHKVKIHPKMIYNRPPLNCQKCQFRFFTDQGLERHLLGSHGLVTSSMQEAANRSKDAGRCPVCGRVYQWKLLNHVARDHNMTLKPAHLSYKCTVCTATFGMYKQFESHVYSAHSVVAKRVMDKKNAAAASAGSAPKNESVLKPLKINDEITIIPQPAAKPTNGAGSSKEDAPSTSGTSISVRNSVGYSNGNPGTSKSSAGSEPPNEPSPSTSVSRSERLVRRKTTSQTDN